MKYQAIITKEFKDTPRCSACTLCVDAMCMAIDMNVSKYLMSEFWFSAPKECPMEEAVPE